RKGLRFLGPRDGDAKRAAGKEADAKATAAKVSAQAADAKAVASAVGAKAAARAAEQVRASLQARFDSLFPRLSEAGAKKRVAVEDHAELGEALAVLEATAQMTEFASGSASERASDLVETAESLLAFTGIGTSDVALGRERFRALLEK